MKAFIRQLVADFDPRLLGFALLVPIFETFRRVAFSLTKLAAQASSPELCVAAAVAGALVPLASMTFASSHGRHVSLGAKVRWGLASTALFAVGCVGVFAGEGLAAALGAVGMFLAAGACVVTLFMGWAHAYTSVEPVKVPLYMGLSMVLGSLGVVWVVSGPGPLILAVATGVCLAASFAILATFTRAARETDGSVEDSSRLSEGMDQWDPIATVKGSMTVTAVGFGLCFFTQGVMSIPPSTYVGDHSWTVYLMGYAVAAAAMVGFSYTQRESFELGNVREKTFFLIPVFAVFLAYFSFVRMLDASGVLKNVLSVGWNASFAAFLMLTMTLVALKHRERGSSVEQLCLPIVALCAGLYTLGTVVYGVLGNNAMYLQVVFSTLYIVGLSLLSTRKASLNEGQKVENRVAELSAQYQLSARESEVLFLLAQDYSISLIAEQLFISIETARTHRKRIYAKLDVHKHEDLLRLVRG